MRVFAPLLCCAALAAALSIPAPALAANEPACACVADFDRLVERLESDYAGFRLGVTSVGQRAAYEARKQELRRQAEGAGDPECLFVLRQLTDFLRDGHLFLQAAPKVEPEEAARLAASAEVIARSESEIRADLTRRATSGEPIDPLEGIWYSAEGYRVGIVRDAKPGRREFAAVMLSADVPGWKPGQVKAEFSTITPGSYRGVIYVADHSARYPIVGTPDAAGVNARIYRNLLLRMAPREWGKEFPLRPEEAGTLDPKDPKAPVVYSPDPGAVVVSMPSHDGQYRASLEAQIAGHREQLLAASTLIVDLRGNEGGGSQTSNPLRPYYVSKSRRVGLVPEPWQPVILSSPDNIEYFRQTSSQGWIPAGLLPRLEAHPGELVPFWDPGKPPPEDDEPEPAELARPAHVGILVDRGVVSAGEAFLLEARQYAKVTLFGENSAGVIDYQNVTMVPLACPGRGLLFGYPMFAGSASLPAGGINGVGIPPDVRIGPDVADPLRFIADYFAKAPKG